MLRYSPPLNWALSYLGVKINSIQKIIQSRIKSLLEVSNGFEAIDHSSTKGTLREGLLTKFLRMLYLVSLVFHLGLFQMHREK